MKPEEFISFLLPKLKDVPVLKSLAIAQACLETGFGKNIFYNNIYGIKCHDPNKYAGCRYAKTKEFVSGQAQNFELAFQTYNSVEECIEDYSGIMNLPRYEKVRNAKNYIEACNAVKECGYSTSPSYPQSLITIIEKYKLQNYDWRYEMKLTENFAYEEFWSGSKSGIKIKPPEELFPRIQQLAQELQKVRDIIKRPIIVTSGWRTPEWNSEVGGVENSYHIQGLAVDSRAVGMLIVDYGFYLARYTNFKGFGINVAKNFIHSDFREIFTIFHY